MKPRGLLLFLGVLFIAAWADTASILQAVQTDWMAPRAAELAAEGGCLAEALTANCAAAGPLPPVRSRGAG